MRPGCMSALGRCASAVERGSESGRTGDVVHDPDPPEANLTKGIATSAESARSYAVLSIVAAALTIGLKVGAYLLTGSVGLFSDAAESVVNLVAAVAALWALIYAARPPDADRKSTRLNSSPAN